MCRKLSDGSCDKICPFSDSSLGAIFACIVCFNVVIWPSEMRTIKHQNIMGWNYRTTVGNSMRNIKRQCSLGMLP